MRSKDVCLIRYEKPSYDPEGYIKLYEKHSRSLTPQQLEVFRALHAWRDQVAREEDESTRCVATRYFHHHIALCIHSMLLAPRTHTLTDMHANPYMCAPLAAPGTCCLTTCCSTSRTRVLANRHRCVATASPC